jgi:small subunit ribosomal protein S6
VIIKPDLSEEELEGTLDTISRFITDRSGVVAEIERQGKKRLAYPIKHNNEGYYALAKIQIEPSLGNELESNLMISENVIRHLLIRLNS